MSDDARPLIDNPYRASHTPIIAGDVNVTDLMARAWERGFAAGQSQAWDSAQAEIDAIRAAGRAAATPDPPKDAHRPWPIAPDTVMPPRRQPVRWGSRADDPPTEIHNDPQTTKAYLAGLAAGRTEAAASPDERLREENERLHTMLGKVPQEQLARIMAAADRDGSPDA